MRTMDSSRKFHIIVLHEYSPGLHAYLKSYEADLSGEENLVEHLEYTTLTYVKSLPDFQEFKLLRVARPKVYLWLNPPHGESLGTKAIHLAGAANSGDLKSEKLLPFPEDIVLEEIAYRDLVIVVQTSLHFKFAVFEQKFRTSHIGLGSESVVAYMGDSAHKIYDAARSFITRPTQNQEDIATIHSLSLYEVNDQNNENYEKVLEREELEPGLLRRSSAVTHGAEVELRDIKTSTLIFVFTATRSLSIPYALFNCESGSYRWASQGHVKLLSQDRVKDLQEVIRTHIEIIPMYGAERGYNITVYEPRGTFKSAYGRQLDELESLELGNESLSPSNCFAHPPQAELSTLRVGQALIIVFGISTQPQQCSSAARVYLEGGHFDEMAEVLVGEGRMADAVCALIAAPRDPDRTRRAVEYLLTGLWQHQSFGVDNPETDSEAVSELLALAGVLRKDMREPEAQEIAMFRARHDADFGTLRDLHLKFVGAANHSAALLCLDPIFSSTLPVQGAPPAGPGSEIFLHLAYFKLLDHLRREESLDTGSVRQRVFAFQPQHGDRFFVPVNSFLYAALVYKSDTVQETGGCVVAHEELRDVLGREIPDYIRLRAKQQHNAYRGRLGAAPCLTMLAEGGCSKVDCQFLHLQPEEITVGWFNARIRLILKEIQILNSASFRPQAVILHWIGVLYSALHPPLQRLGSIATLDLGDTPETTEGFRVLREWVWQACDRLRFSTLPPQVQYINTFIPQFMPLCTMAYDFDFERARAYVPRTRMCGDGRWPLCLTRPGLADDRHFVVRDFVQFLRGDVHHSLILGTLYLRRILMNEIPADVGSFCDAVERLCGLYILAYRFMVGRGVLHDVTLPRSWFIGLSRSLPLLDKNTAYLPHFVNDMVELLQRIGGPQFKHNGSRLNPLYASVYITRICLCLCLLGYNINDERLKVKVVQAIHRLRGSGQLSLVYRQYTEAPDWQGLVHVFTKSLSDSTLDEMILLLHSEAPKPQGWVSRYVGTVIYEKVEEIPDLLRVKAAGGADTRAPADPTPGGPLLEPGPPVDNGGQEEAPVSPEEVRAALTIEAAYRRAMARKKEVLKLKGDNATRARLWSLLRDRASSMEMPRHKHYRLLMQGPLVHVLVCLDNIKMFAEQAKSDLMKQIQGCDHQRLEEFMDMFDRSRDLQRTALNLQKKLGYQGPLHNDPDVLALKAAVLEVGRLIDRLSEFPGPVAIKTKERIKEDWKLGWDGIVREPTRDQRAQRPKLMVDGGDR